MYYIKTRYCCFGPFTSYQAALGWAKLRYRHYKLINTDQDFTCRKIKKPWQFADPRPKPLRRPPMTIDDL